MNHTIRPPSIDAGASLEAYEERILGSSSKDAERSSSRPYRRSSPPPPDRIRSSKLVIIVGSTHLGRMQHLEVMRHYFDDSILPIQMLTTNEDLVRHYPTWFGFTTMKDIGQMGLDNMATYFVEESHRYVLPTRAYLQTMHRLKDGQKGMFGLTSPGYVSFKGRDHGRTFETLAIALDLADEQLFVRYLQAHRQLDADEAHSILIEAQSDSSIPPDMTDDMLLQLKVRHPGDITSLKYRMAMGMSPI